MVGFTGVNMLTIHGWSFDKSVWRDTPFSVAEHLELPGHGNSSYHELSIEKLAHTVGKDFSGGEIVGWSLGATVSLLVAFYYPEKVEKITLFSPTPSFCEIFQNRTVCRNFLRKLNRDFENTLKWFRKECGCFDDRLFPLPEKDKSIALLESYMKLNISTVLKDIKVPVDIYVGEKDRITGLKGALETFKLLSNVTLNVYPDREHYFLKEG